MIRQAQMDDYEQIEKIMQQVHEMHVEWRPDVYCHVETVVSRDDFAQLLRNGEALVYVERELVIGLVFFKERVIENIGGRAAKKTLFVDTVAVLEGYRGKGVGHALFGALKQIAGKKACEGIELQVNARNERAMQMYKDYGFTEKSVNMELYF